MRPDTRGAGAVAAPLLAALLLLPLAPTAADTVPDPEEALDLLPPPPDPSLTPRPPITILSDADFHIGNGVVGGSGTVEDPYIIEGWYIVGGGPGAIFISGTTAHVVVRGNQLQQVADVPPFIVCNAVGLSCVKVDPASDTNFLHWQDPDAPFLFPPGAVGLRTFETRNVHFLDNVVVGYPYGAVVEHSQDVTLEGATIRPPVTGAYLRRTVIDASNNETLWEVRDGACEGLVNCPIRQRFIPMDADAAVLVRGGTGLRIDGNDIRNHTFGVKLYGGEATLTANTVAGAYTAFLGYIDSQATYRDNVVTASSTGWYVCGVGTVAVIEDNRIIGNGRHEVGGPFPGGIAIDNPPWPDPCMGAPHAEVRGNTIADNAAGVWTAGVPGVVVEDNRIEGNDMFGLFQQKAPIVVQGNTFVGNRDGAILRQLFPHPDGVSIVEENVFLDNENATHLLGREKPVLRNNSFEGNTGYAVLNSDDAQYSVDPTAATTPVDARWNWWGSASGPEEGPGGTFGAVTVDPWLHRDPSWSLPACAPPLGAPAPQADDCPG